MEIEFLKAKNGEQTARFNSLFLHSAYSPINESQRYIQNLEITFTPELIVFIEPCLSYTLPFIKERFSKSKTAVIRFTKSFNQFNSDFDYIFYADSTLNNQLLNTFTEEQLCSTYFLPWQPSEKAFSELSTLTWNEIKKVTQKAKTFLVTREYFEKKWFLNTCNNISKIKTNIILKKQIDIPVAIIASGPSLKEALPLLKKYQNKIFIISLSSAISCCLQNGILPDLAFSTDGGFWAGEHLKQLKHKRIPLVLGCEALCPTSILKSNQIILLNYCEGLSADLLKTTQIKTMNGIRNGTVSGTALDFALSYSNSYIYFFGLDLASNKGFSHTNPNENEKTNSLKENRLFTREKRITPGTFKNESLLLYEEWFKNKSLQNRKVFRIINDQKKQNTLGQIKDISINNFEEELKTYKDSEKSFENFFIETKQSINKNSLLDYIKKVFNDNKTLKFLFPLDYVALNHNTGNNMLIQNRISEKKLQIITKVEKLFK